MSTHEKYFHEYFQKSQIAHQSQPPTDWHRVAQFLADRTNGRAIGTVLRLSSVVCLWRYVLWLNGAS